MSARRLWRLGEFSRCLELQAMMSSIDPSCGARNRLSFAALPFITPKAPLMRHCPLKTSLAVSLVALPLMACQTDTGTGFATGVAGGAVVGDVGAGTRGVDRAPFEFEIDVVVRAPADGGGGLAGADGLDGDG